MTWKQWILGLGYLAFFMASTLAMAFWQRRQRKRRKPFHEDLKLLRSAGETQLKWVLSFEENLILYVPLAALAPVLVTWPILLFVKRLTGWWALVGLAALVIAFVGVFWVAARWLRNRMTEGWDRYLGYFGERFVAEQLEPLKAQGWRIFHDVPCEAHGKKFNIDHVAAGPGGVYVIETKTRRKGAARPGYKDNVVSFDGHVLDWPWGEDEHGLEQAERNAIWLADTLRTDAKERVHVSPILALPGWWLEERKPFKNPRLARAANPKWLSKWLGESPEVLAPERIEAITAALELRCRDVKYGA